MSVENQEQQVEAKELSIEKIKAQLKSELKEELKNEISKEFHCHSAFKKKKRLIILVSLFWFIIGLLIGTMCGHERGHHFYGNGYNAQYSYPYDQGFNGGQQYHIVQLDDGFGK